MRTSRSRCQLDLDLKKEKIKLYGFDFSPPCMKVRVLLNYYGIPYEWIQAMPGQKKDDLDDSYKKVPKLAEWRAADQRLGRHLPYAGAHRQPDDAVRDPIGEGQQYPRLLGALEKEITSSYYGIVCASSSFMASWSTTTGKLARPVLPYVLGLVAIAVGPSSSLSRRTAATVPA